MTAFIHSSNDKFSRAEFAKLKGYVYFFPSSLIFFYWSDEISSVQPNEFDKRYPPTQNINHFHHLRKFPHMPF